MNQRRPPLEYSTTVASSTVGTVVSSRSGIQRSHDGSFVRTTYSGKGWACDMTGVDQDNFVHGRWTRMVDVPHVGEWKYDFRYRGQATSIHCLFFIFYESYCLHYYDGGVWNTAAQWTWHVHHSLLPHVMPRLQIFLTFSLTISSQMFLPFFLRHNCFLCLF